MSSNLLVPITLQILGCAVIITECLIPTAGILALVSAGLFGSSLYIIFTHFSKTVAFGFVVADSVIIPVVVLIGLRFLAHSPFALRTQLGKKEGVQSQSDDLIKLIGHTGVALSLLRPSGIGQFEHQRIDVTTHGEFLEQGTPIRVIAAEGNQVIVTRNIP